MKSLMLVCIIFWRANACAQDTVRTLQDDPQSQPATDATLPDTRLTNRLIIRYENDLFAGTDRYFSQGVHVEFKSPALNALDKYGILSPGSSRARVTMLEAHLEAYTPSTIRADTILRGDRPYAGLIYLTARGTRRVEKRSTLSGALSVGVIGPAALGEEIQVGIHRATGDFIPLGWQHQIRNDVVLNYGLAYTYHRSYGPLGWKALAQADAGTLTDRVTAGLNTTFYPLYWLKSSRVVLAVDGAIKGMAVAYDSRLQGGLFNRSSPYTISANNITRLVGRADVYFSLRYGRFDFRYTHTWLTREFRSGLPHAWGGLQLSVDW